MRIYIIISLLICVGFSQNVDSLKIVLNDLDNKKGLLSENLITIKKDLKQISAKIDTLNNIIITAELKRDTSIYSLEINARMDTPLRDGPNFSSNELVTILKGKRYIVYNSFNGYFVKAIYNNHNGYIFWGHLDKNLPTHFKTQYSLQREQHIAEEAKRNKELRSARNIKREEEKKQTDKIRREELYKKFGRTDGERIFKHQIWIGMTSRMAEDARGRPDDINRTVYTWGVKEQWVYEKYDYDHIYLYFEDGILTVWQD